MKKVGNFCISFDFELYWAFVGEWTLESYKQNLLGVHEAIPRILELFDKYDIHATWATVGFLMCEDYDELLSFLPNVRPQYKNRKISQYNYLEDRNVREKLRSDNEFRKCHFAPGLVREILSTHGQELATHTFSHYYCLEPGQSAAEFEADLVAAKYVAAKKYAADINSIIFPRHQTNDEYLKTCHKHNVNIYRGNQQHRIYEATNTVPNSVRAQKLLDSYFPLTGHNVYSVGFEETGMMNIPASSFLRPHSEKLSRFEYFKLKRITSSMLRAAKQGKNFHLWWHPHNFGKDTDQNIAFLERILKYYVILKDEYGLASRNMKEIASRFEVQ